MPVSKQKGPLARSFFQKRRKWRRSDGLGNPSFQFAFRQGADLGGSHLPILEQHQGRDAANAIGARDAGILINVELGYGHLALQLVGDLFQSRADHLAGSAPFGPEIHHDGTTRANNVGFEVRIGDFDGRHWQLSRLGAQGKFPAVFHSESKNAGRSRQPASSPRRSPVSLPGSIAASAASRRSSSSAMATGPSVQISSMRRRLSGHSGARTAR